ncbi:MAG: tetrahydrodipicolinate N-succinyltransferase N-terminal domain-containing protein [Pseudomonadota bacterium]
MTDEVFAFAVGVTRGNSSGQTLDCYFPAPLKSPAPEAARVIARHFDAGASDVLPEVLSAFVRELADADANLTPQIARYRQMLEADRPLRAVRLDSDAPIESIEAAYLKLHLLSHRLALPNTLNLEGIFAHLPNVAWTSRGPVDPAELDAALVAARLQDEHLEVTSVDKFPRMTNYVVPSGVRIADAARIRLGAYLGEGTTVMHEGFVNFNAGAMGPNMLEGRVSQGVVVGANSDLGGSSSTMGTLSGGGGIRITIGNNCLIGANGGTGIPLGDRCTIEAGLYITAGTPVAVVDEHGEVVKFVKARELAGGSDMLFIRNSANGQIECRTNRRAIELNEALHAHN